MGKVYEGGHKEKSHLYGQEGIWRRDRVRNMREVGSVQQDTRIHKGGSFVLFIKIPFKTFFQPLQSAPSE